MKIRTITTGAILLFVSAISLTSWNATAQEQGAAQSAGETLPMSSEAPPITLSDVTVGSPYYVQISYLFKNGIVTGYEDKTFRTNALINRAEALTMIQRALTEEPKTEDEKTTQSEQSPQSKSTQSFSDLKSDHWAMPAFKFFTDKKITEGYKDGTVQPEKPINLAESLKIIMETERLRNPTITFQNDQSERKSSFSDVTGDEWFAKYIMAANKRTLLTYGFKLRIEPNKNLTRGMLADLIYRTLRTRIPGHFFGKGTFYSDFFENRGTANGEKYHMDELTAANKVLPFGTMLRVTYLRNNQSVDVRVNDRGPFTPSLDLDMSRKAFSLLASPSEGIIPIEYEIISAP